MTRLLGTMIKSTAWHGASVSIPTTSFLAIPPPTASVVAADGCKVDCDLGEIFKDFDSALLAPCRQRSY
jgi:hypothetical protein